MTSQNFIAMPKDRARRANSPAQAIWDCHRGMELVGKAEVDGYLPQRRSGKCKGASSLPSPEREAARGIKLLKEWQKKRGQRSNKNSCRSIRGSHLSQQTPLPHGLQT